MKPFAAFLLLVTACGAAWGVGPQTGTTSTNELVIECDDGFEYAGATAIYRGNVRATDPQMSLRCEVLTVTFQTNQTNSAKIEQIVAETRVIVTQQQGQATGDLAVYLATNEVVLLMGNAVLETPQGKLLGDRVIFDRKSNKLTAPGPVRMVLKPDAFGEAGMSLLGTNAFRLPGAAPAKRNVQTEAAPGTKE
jgi:lipopolysaccharide transport protein LptA